MEIKNLEDLKQALSEGLEIYAEGMDHKEVMEILSQLKARKPAQYVNINGHKVRLGGKDMNAMEEDNDIYYIPCLWDNSGTNSKIYTSRGYHHRRAINKGIAFRNVKDARAMAKAMLDFKPWVEPYPRAETEAPKLGTMYFYPIFGREFLTDFHTWADDSTDYKMLINGFVHLNRENATAHAKHLIEVSKGNLNKD